MPRNCISSFVPLFLHDLVPPYLGRTYSFPCRRHLKVRLNPSSARLDLNGNCQRGSQLRRGVNSFVAEVRSKSCRARGRRNELVERLGLPTRSRSPYSPEPIYAERILKKVRRLVEGRLYGRIEEKVVAISIRWLVAPGRWDRPTAPAKPLTQCSSRRASAGQSSTMRFLTRGMSSSSVLSTRAMSFASCFNLMKMLKSASSSFARWT